MASAGRPLLAHRRTSTWVFGMSAMCHVRTFGRQQSRRPLPNSNHKGVPENAAVLRIEANIPIDRLHRIARLVLEAIGTPLYLAWARAIWPTSLAQSISIAP